MTGCMALKRRERNFQHERTCVPTSLERSKPLLFKNPPSKQSSFKRSAPKTPIVNKLIQEIPAIRQVKTKQVNREQLLTSSVSRRPGTLPVTLFLSLLRSDRNNQNQM
ncbi:hypothetical protein CPB84DRAFT_1773970, partial [Gymnopilus junonius]